jgi:hypothetical protein
MAFRETQGIFAPQELDLLFRDAFESLRELGRKIDWLEFLGRRHNGGDREKQTRPQT